MKNLNSIHRSLVAVLSGMSFFAASLVAQDPATLRWVSGDVHMHPPSCPTIGDVNQNPDIVTYEDIVDAMQAADLQVGAVLLTGPVYEPYVNEAWTLRTRTPLFTGEDLPASRPGFIVHEDLEISGFPADQMGHLALLGLHKLEFPDPSIPRSGSGLPIVDWAVSQGPRVLVGMFHAHVWPEEEWAFAEPIDLVAETGEIVGLQLLEFPVHVANGTMSFLTDEFESSPTTPIAPGMMRLWSMVQNSGFRVALAGGTDGPSCLPWDSPTSPDARRTYALIEGDLSYDAWLDGIRAGRTVFALGGSDWMDMTIDGVRLGGEVPSKVGSPLEVVLETDLSSRQDLRVLVNGEPVQTLTVDSGPQTHTVQLTVDQSSWISAQTPRVQTSATYAIVNGKPIRVSSDDACYLVHHMDHLSDLAVAGAFRNLDAADVLPAYQNARDVFEQRFLEAGGKCVPGGPLSNFYYTRDSDLDDRGNAAIGTSSSQWRDVGEVDRGRSEQLNRLIAKFDLPEFSVDLKQARLRFFIDDVTGVPAGPLSLFHSVDDNDFDRMATDYEDTMYLDTQLDLLKPGDEAQRFYELDVTDLVRADYETDVDNPISAFRLQVTEATFVDDDQSNLYRVAMPGRAMNRPELVLTFVPEPSALCLSLGGLFGLLRLRKARR